MGGSGPSRTVTATPVANSGGTTTITLTVSDGSLTATDTFTVTVNAVNDAPTISNVANQTINEDGTTGALAFTVGDTESSASLLTVTRTSSNTTLIPNANVVIGGSGASRTVTVTPAANQNGTATITLFVTDPGGASASDTFVVTVNAVNDAPTISNVANQTINEDGTTGALSFTINDLETAATALTVTRTSSNTTLFPLANVVLGGSSAGRTVTATPVANSSGTTTITVTVSDGALTATDTFTVTVNAVNDAPTISNVANQTINEDGTTGSLAFTVNDLETAATALTVTRTSSNTTLFPLANVVLGSTGASRTVTATPVANSSGTTTITLTVSDGALTATDTFTVTVNAVNDAPTITNVANQTINEDGTTGSLAFTVNDLETAAGSLTVTRSSSNTTLFPLTNVVLGGSGPSRTVTATPVANSSGTTTITLTVSDGSLTATDTFTVTVNSVNDAPTITNVTNQTINEDGTTGSLAFTVNDLETAATALTVTRTSSNTTLFPLANVVLGGSGPSRTVTATPVANSGGTTTITLTVSDGSLTASDTFTVTVNAVNDAPTISNVANQTINEDGTTGALAFTINDQETAATSLTVTKSSSNTTLFPVGNVVLGGSGAGRTVTATPVANSSGTATITLTVTDPGGAAATDTFTVTVNSVNDAPTITNVANQTINEDGTTGSLAFTVNDLETAATALTVTRTSSNTTLFPLANIVLGSTGASRTVTATPVANSSGTTTITLTVSDGALTATDTFVVTVNAVNDAPTISNVANQTINEDGTTGSLPFTVNDQETAAGSLTVTRSSSNTTLFPLANVVLGGSGAARTVTATPVANSSGSATITLTVTDPGGAAASDTFTVTVNAVNDAPTISNVANQSINEDGTTGALAFTVGDAESAASLLTVTRTSSNTTLIPNAAVVIGGSGASRTVTVTPAANQNGTATITLTVTDPGGAAASDTFTVTVNSVNDAPTITNIANQNINEDGTTGSLAFTVNDLETAATALTVTRTSSNTTLFPLANVVLGSTGASRTVTATPVANSSGTTTITLTVSDGALTATDTFTVTVNAVNDAPTISNVANQTITEDGTTGSLAFTVNDQETAAASLTVTRSSSNTTLFPLANVVLGGSGPSRTVTATPVANSGGTTTITLTVSDGSLTATDTFTVTVNAVNDAPTISNVANQTINEDGTTGALAFTVGDTESAASLLTVTRTSSNTTLIPNANVVIGGSGASRTVTVTPAANQNGTATVTLTVTDPGGAAASDTFTVTVNAVNDAPTISNVANQTINEDGTTGALAFTVGDTESSASLLAVTRTSNNTTLIPNAAVVIGGSGPSRTVTVTPAASQNGTAMITLTVTDPGGAAASETFTVTVNAVNDAPTITNVTNQTINEDGTTGSLAFTINDQETAATSLTVTRSSSNTTLFPLANVVLGGSGAARTVTATPVANSSGTTTITLTVSDGALTATDTFVVTVNAVNDAPTISNVANQTINEDGTTGALAFAVNDLETAATALTVTRTSSNTTLFPLANVVLGGTGASRTVTATPVANSSGTTTVTVTVSDGALTVTDTFTVTVNAVNDAPTITNVANQTINEDGTTGALAFTINDLETAATALTVTRTSSNTTLFPLANVLLGGSGAARTVTATPVANSSGSATITLTVTDPGGAAASDTFTVTVNAVNDAPTISNVANQTINEDGTTGALAFTVGDAESAASLLTVTRTSSNTTLIPNAAVVIGGSGPNRTVTVTPAANQNGTATITLTVTDPGGAAASDTFVVTVNAVNDAPTISNVANQTINEDGTTGSLAFTVNDLETAATALTVTRTSSNTTLFPLANVVLGSTGASRTVTATPVANSSGTTTITLTVSDGALTATDTFTVTVNAVNDAPTISNVANQTITEDGTTGSLAFTVNDQETAAASLTVTRSSSNTTLFPLANVVLGGSGPSRTVTATPVANSGGTTTITLTVSDGSLTATDTFTVTVNAVNDAPTISNVANQTINEDGTTGALAFTVGDTESAASLLTVTRTSSNTTLIPNANVVIGGSGASRTVTVTPAANQNGTATVTLTVTDPGGAAASDTFTVTVNAVNDAPTISNVANQTINEDGTTGALSFVVADNESSPLSLTVTRSSSNTTLFPLTNVVLGGTGAARTVTATPVANQNGTATITLTVTDPGGAAASDTFTVTVNAVNDAPTITNVANQTINEDGTTGALAFTINDLETAATALTVTRTSSNTTLFPLANVLLGGSGAARTVTATPVANSSGSATITLTVTDPGGAAASDTFTVTVNAVNDAPTISNVANQTINEDGTTGALAFTVGDAESAASLLTVTRTSSNTTLIPNANVVIGGSGASRTVTVTPAANQNGTATITLTVSDGALTATDTFVVTVNAVNDAPTISNVANQTINEDGTTGSLAFTVNDLETAATSLTVTRSSSNTTLFPLANVVLGGSGAARTVTATPVANSSGTTTITLTVSDGALTATDTFVVTVNAVNDAPTISNVANQTITEDGTTGALAFTINDLETAATALTVTRTSSNTTLFPLANVVLGGSGAARTVTATPVANSSGSATITLTVTDPGGAAASDTFSVTVNALNDAPTISNVANQTINEDGTTGALAFTVGDAESAASLLTVTRTSSNTTLIPNAAVVIGGSGPSRTVTVTPAANQNGTATITLTVTDPGGAAASDTFTVTVNAVNDAPTISNVANQTINEDGTTGALAFTVGDAESAASLLTVTRTSSNTTLIPNANVVIGGSGASRTVTVTPAANQNGTATITLFVTDPGGAAASDTFVVTVNAVNDAPTVTNVANQTINEDGTTGALAFTVGDTESSASLLTVTRTSSNTTLIPNANVVIGGSGASRTVTVTPAANQNGTATITLFVTDPGGASASDTFVVTVNAVNDAPTISNVANQTINEDGTTGALAFTINDLETAATALTVTRTSSNTTLFPLANVVLGSTGASRTVTATPVANSSGTTTITLTVSDGALTATDTFTVTVNAVNDAPTISNVANQTINEDGTTGSLAFTINDLETAATALTVTRTSSNTGLVPLGNVLLGGSGAARTVTATPVANSSGTTTITLTVSDGALTATDTFTVTVNAVNDAPTISNVANQTINEDGTTGSLAFTINDLETAATALTVTRTSSNTTLFPLANVVLGGSGAGRTVTATPVANSSGTTTITVTVSDGALTATDTFTVTVNAVNDAPVASAGANQTAGEGSAVPFTGTFTDADAGDTHTFLWDFGDGTTATTQNATHTYADNPTAPATAYTATFTITDASGASGSDTASITVNNVIPVANGTFPSAGNEGSALTFTSSPTDAGTADTFTYSWSFGDGATSTTQNPAHVYADDGSFTVTLTVTDDDGGASTPDTGTVVVANANPVVTATIPATGTENVLLNFTGSFSDAGSADTHTFVWDFGDGTTDTSTLTPTHTYTAPGTFTTTLTVTDDDGGTGTSGGSVVVGNAAPVANAGANQTGNEGSPITFTGTFTDGGTGHTFLWDFGDGTTATTQNATHTYADNPTAPATAYTATFTITDASGASGSDTASITVNNVIPVANGTFPSAGNEGSALTFTSSPTDAGTADTFTYSWSFGDGATSTSQNPAHVYADDGSFTVTLTVTDDDGGASTPDTGTVVVANANPVVSAGTAPTGGENTPLSFSGSFTDAGSADTHTFVWDFGDGTTDTSTLTPTHTYTAPGTFTTTLTVTDDDGGVGSDSISTVVGNVAPVVAIQSTTSTPEGVFASFVGSFTDGGTGHTFVWDFGDGATDTTSLTPSHIYADDGTFTITLTVTDPGGLSTSATETQAVTNLNPSVNAGVAPTGPEATPLSFSGTFTDAGTADTHTFVWDFGDGSTDSTTLTPTHTYSAPGIFTVTLTVTDDDAGVGSDSISAVVTKHGPAGRRGRRRERRRGRRPQLRGLLHGRRHRPHVPVGLWRRQHGQHDPDADARLRRRRNVHRQPDRHRPRRPVRQRHAHGDHRQPGPDDHVVCPAARHRGLALHLSRGGLRSGHGRRAHLDHRRLHPRLADPQRRHRRAQRHAPRRLCRDLPHHLVVSDDDGATDAQSFVLVVVFEDLDGDGMADLWETAKRPRPHGTRRRVPGPGWGRRHQPRRVPGRHGSQRLRRPRHPDAAEPHRGRRGGRLAAGPRLAGRGRSPGATL